MKTKEKTNKKKFEKIFKKKKTQSWRQKNKLKKREKQTNLIKEHLEFKKLKEDNIVNGDFNQEKPSLKSNSTISMAIPGSIYENAQSLELKAYLASQISRAAAIFQVDEIIIFDETAMMTEKELDSFQAGTSLNNLECNKKVRCNFVLARLLEYLECPQYLRKHIFPLQKELRFAGLMNPLDAPHHLRSDELSCPYREAVVLNKPMKEGKVSLCDIGLIKECRIDKQLISGTRVTVKLKSTDLSKKRLQATCVSPSTPKTEGGLYWGYSVRVARSLGAIFQDSPYDGYGLTIGTSERGSPIENFKPSENFSHSLIVFGGLGGLESCLDSDQSLTQTDPSKLFDHYLNVCPNQGSRTIRTEEALLIALSALKPKLSISSIVENDGDD